MSVLAMALYTAILLYYGIRSFQQGRDNYFIAIQKNQGYCTSIIKTISISIVVSINDGTRGVWQPSPEYESNSTAYSLELLGFKGIHREYS